jgi:hypothetical protein
MKTLCVERKIKKQRLDFELWINHLIIKFYVKKSDAKIVDV